MSTTHAPALASVETGVILRRDVILLDPSEVDEPADLLHLVLGDTHPRAGEAYCGQRLDDGPMETSLVDKTGRGGAQEAPDQLVLMCSRCARIDDVLHAV